MKQKITQKLCRELVAAGQPCEVADTDIRGFTIRIGKRSATFYLRRKVQGRDREIKIGAFPDMQPDEARRAVADKLAGFLNGDPNLGERPYAVPTVENAFTDYINSHKNRSHLISISKHLRPMYSIRLTKLTQEDVLGVFNALSDHPATANLCVKYLSAAITAASKKMRTPVANPCAGIKLHRLAPRKRFLATNEAPRLIDALWSLSGTTIYGAQADAILMMLYTGQRKMNVLTMRTDEIDGDVWTIPEEKFKTDKEITVKLNSFALKIIARRMKDCTDGYLFTWRGQHMSDVRKTFRRACEIAGVTSFRIHDLRRSLGTWMLSSGASIETVSKTLGHSSIRVTEQVYAHMLPDRISAATDEAVRLMMTGGKSADKSADKTAE